MSATGASGPPTPPPLVISQNYPNDAASETIIDVAAPNKSSNHANSFQSLRSSFKQLKVRQGDFSITDGSVDIKTAPGYLEHVHVGHTEWLAAWFPYNPDHITIAFGAKGSLPLFSIPEAILVANFQYFSVAIKKRYGAWKETSERIFTFDRDESGAFGLIISFLMTGTFPQHPNASIQPTFEMIRDFIVAYQMVNYLGYRCEERFNRAVCLRLRQVLCTNRQALCLPHVKLLYSFAEKLPRYYKSLCTVFAQAAVKPYMQCWMAKATRDRKSLSMVGGSAAFDEHCGKNVRAWAEIVASYVSLVNSNRSYASDVQKQVQMTMEKGQRNRFAPNRKDKN